MVMFAFEGRRRAEGARKRKRERRKRSRIRERGKSLYPGWVLAPSLNAAQLPPSKRKKEGKGRRGRKCSCEVGPVRLVGRNGPPPGVVFSKRRALWSKKTVEATGFFLYWGGGGDVRSGGEGHGLPPLHRYPSSSSEPKWLG